MTLCWSLDKLGPMTRSVEDTMLVLEAITGPDPGDVASVPSKLDYDAAAKIDGLRVGYFPQWMKEAPATDVDRAALDTVKKLGMVPVEVAIPNWPYDSLQLILFAEAAAAFEELTLTHGVDQLKMQVPDAWPNSFRQARFLSAVDFVQSDRFRRKVANEMGRVLSQVDLLLVPSLRDEMLIITNFTVNRRSRYVPGLSRCQRSAATGRLIRPTRRPGFLHRGACPTGLRSSAGCLMRAGWGALDWRWSAALVWRTNGRQGFDASPRVPPGDRAYRSAGRTLLRHDAGRLWG
jgi:hypothetical protein